MVLPDNTARQGSIKPYQHCDWHSFGIGGESQYGRVALSNECSTRIKGYLQEGYARNAEAASGAPASEEQGSSSFTLKNEERNEHQTIDFMCDTFDIVKS
mmetsp:Transcript_21630/g.63509  ORF Transcript_21630/g.63509 Transcript_21630/m.63509 type:complete len:100 (-) Transcript_21630:21-320(-)